MTRSTSGESRLEGQKSSYDGELRKPTALPLRKRRTITVDCKERYVDEEIERIEVMKNGCREEKAVVEVVVAENTVLILGVVENPGLP